LDQKQSEMVSINPSISQRIQKNLAENTGELIHTATVLALCGVYYYQVERQVDKRIPATSQQFQAFGPARDTFSRFR
jgi:hypothetical protein